MNRKIIALLLAIIMVASLAGCQLAREDAAATKSQDRLIGVYVSYEYVDLFDMEGYINDNLNAIGGEITVDGDSKEYEGRMYATLKESEETTSHGEKYTHTMFVFEELEGVGMFAPTITDPLNDERTYISSGSGEGFADSKSHFKEGDSEDGLELEGTLYISSGTMSDAIYINPVYQSEDDRVYLVTGQGFAATGDNGEGGVYTQTITNKVTITENGNSKGYSSSVKVSVATMNPTQKVAILQMDKDSNVIERVEYTPDGVPAELLPEGATDYIIVESTKLTYDKQTTVERELFTKDDDSLWFFRSGDKVFIKSYTAIQWEEDGNL